MRRGTAGVVITRRETQSCVLGLAASDDSKNEEKTRFANVDLT